MISAFFYFPHLILVTFQTFKEPQRIPSRLPKENSKLPKQRKPMLEKNFLPLTKVLKLLQKQKPVPKLHLSHPNQNWPSLKLT